MLDARQQKHLKEQLVGTILIYAVEGIIDAAGPDNLDTVSHILQNMTTSNKSSAELLLGIRSSTLKSSIEQIYKCMHPGDDVAMGYKRNVLSNAPIALGVLKSAITNITLQYLTTTALELFEDTHYVQDSTVFREKEQSEHPDRVIGDDAQYEFDPQFLSVDEVGSLLRNTQVAAAPALSAREQQIHSDALFASIVAGQGESGAASALPTPPGNLALFGTPSVPLIPESRSELLDFYTSEASSWEESPNNMCKILLIGDRGTPKSLFVRTAAGLFPRGDYISTIGVDFKTFTKEHETAGNIRYQLWDTAGQERFRTITSSYYRGAHVIFLMIGSGLSTVRNWMSEVRRHRPGGVKVCFIKSQQSPHPIAEVQALADEYGVDLYVWDESTTVDTIQRWCESAFEASCRLRGVELPTAAEAAIPTRVGCSIQ